MAAAAPHIFGVRHLSPAAAWHLWQLLDRVRPKLVLIEGSDDADDLIPHIVSPKSKLPIAILAYTADTPVRTFCYPLATYSPEYQALVWCQENKAKARFMDLPSSVFLGLMDRDDGTAALEKDRPPKKEDDDADEEQDESAIVEEAKPARASVYEKIAQLAGEPDYETYWERHFEQLHGENSYRNAAFTYGVELRSMEDFSNRNAAETLVREAYMRRKIQQAIAEGVKPEQIVVVTGAFHASVLGVEHPPMSDEEFAKLRRRESKMTLMPYSFFKLSSQSGYGAGNHAPAYFEMVWNSFNSELDQSDRSDRGIFTLPTLFLTQVVRELRSSGTFRSTAEVIEGVRLAEAMASMKDSLPTLRELQDAAITLLGQGDPNVVREPLLRVEVGTAIGALAKGVSQTSIQDDFYRELARLKLEPFKTSVKKELELDLRENRRVKSQEAAFLDLHRSSFLHRLAVLDVPFAQKQAVRQEGTTWAEKWALQWTPEAEIAIVEAVLLGETIELAVAVKFKQRLENCKSVAEASTVIRQACECGMSDSIELARQTLQRLANDSSDFTALAGATHELGFVIRYGDVRQFDAEPLKPLLEQLFLEGVLTLVGASNCDLAAAKKMVIGINELNKVALDYTSLIDEATWVAELQKLARADHLNPLLSGYACALLVERNLISNEELAREVSRRLSPGIEADLGAGWFEGLAKRNRYALLTRLALWEQLDKYVGSLSEDEFKRALVFLRRAFGDFSPAEKRSITENLGEIWGANPDRVSEALSTELSEKEKAKLDELSDFNFDDV
jgi:Arc/MetJ-type ribon-helix-helix transcriptional regulator